MLHPDGAHFDSTFDAADRFQYANVTPVGSSGSYRLLTYAYDALGRPTMINPASSFRANAYDPVSRLSALSWAFAGGAGNVAYTLGYNPASQIISDQNSNSAFIWQGAVAGTTSYAVNGLNQYTSVGAAAFGYDADGDLISDGHSTYGYDAENRLISAAGAATAKLVYDPLGRLWQTTGPSTGTTTFLHDGDQIDLEYNGSGTLLRRYMWGPGVDAPVVWDEGGALNCTGTHALSADRQGSIIATADCWGNQQVVNTYDPYGVPAAGNVGRFQYTGQAWIPELGMYYYKARIYAPSLGRFMQTDPVGYKDQVNLYAYAGNDPVNGADPSGDCDCRGNGSFGEWSEGNAANYYVSTAPAEPKEEETQQQDATQPSGGGRIGPSDGSGHSALPTDRSLERQKADFNNPKLNGIPEAKQQEAIGMGAPIAAGMAAGAAVVAAPEVAAATGRALGPRGNVFGRQYLGGRAIFTGKNFRLGWGWNGPKGVQQLRLSGKWIDAIKGEKNAHIDFPLTLDKW